MTKYAFLTKEILQKDYDELGTLSAIGQKYDMPTSSVKTCARRLGIKMDPSGGKCKYTINEDIFDKDSEIGFYIAGFIAADGNIFHDDRSNTSCLTIVLSSKDKGHLTTIKDAMSFTGPILDYTQYPKGFPPLHHSDLRIYCSKKIIHDLESNFGIVPQKSLIYKFPDRIIKHELVHHFMRGYNDGDGCFTGKRISFELLGTEQFLKVYEGILKDKCLLSSKATTLNRNNIARLRFSGNNSVGKIATFLYKNSTIHLPRKFDIVKHLIESN